MGCAHFARRFLCGNRVGEPCGLEPDCHGGSRSPAMSCSMPCLLAYLAPVVLLGLIARRLDALGWLQVPPRRRHFGLGSGHDLRDPRNQARVPGAMHWWHGRCPAAESYAYSAVWLVSALALFAAGIKLGRQYIRYAGLGRHGSGSAESLPLGYVGIWRGSTRSSPSSAWASALSASVGSTSALCKNQKRWRLEALTTKGGKHGQGSAE